MQTIMMMISLGGHIRNDQQNSELKWVSQNIGQKVHIINIRIRLRPFSNTSNFLDFGYD